MTFSLAVHDAETGEFGLIVTSSSPAVAARCTNLRAGVGAASSQNVTNPTLGVHILDALEQGQDAEQAVATARAAEAFPEVRQLTAVDAHGRAFAWSGAGTLGTHASRTAQGAVAAGNLLASTETVDALLAAYLSARAGSLEERLLAGLQAGLAAGGEAGPVRSAGIAVIGHEPFRLTDLRVDDADAPIDELARLVELWLPQREAYRIRAVNPEAAPSYGVPGDA